MKEESSLPSGRIQWYAFIKAERPESPAAEDPAAFLRETLSGQETHACPFLFVRYLFEAVHCSQDASIRKPSRTLFTLISCFTARSSESLTCSASISHYVLVPLACYSESMHDRPVSK